MLDCILFDALDVVLRCLCDNLGRAWWDVDGGVFGAAGEAGAQLTGCVCAALLSIFAHVDGSWLVTGGLGMLGLMMAGWLREYGAAHEWLVSRSGRARDATSTAASAGRCMVQLARCDVSQASEARWVVCASTHPPTTGVLHAGGVLRDAMLLNQSASRTMAVHAPKVCGAPHLRASLAAHSVDTSVLFSSIASLLGNGGQANYVSANAALDSFAHQIHGAAWLVN
ncbi:hypothetical protein PPROV_000012000 [Pycnococcus provasolii]|uniref:Ketoreductase domain-containing protein n=1 Tax=Pycnococcus provasolii TaxID=41880 RepID=A0A830H329_9CHLO|nr:hypothetical protein PPROV_000012000 [Pycnococcus provasolii]